MGSTQHGTARSQLSMAQHINGMVPLHPHLQGPRRLVASPVLPLPLGPLATPCVEDQGLQGIWGGSWGLHLLPQHTIRTQTAQQTGRGGKGNTEAEVAL